MLSYHQTPIPSLAIPGNAPPSTAFFLLFLPSFLALSVIQFWLVYYGNHTLALADTHRSGATRRTRLQCFSLISCARTYCQPLPRILFYKSRICQSYSEVCLIWLWSLFLNVHCASLLSPPCALDSPSSIIFPFTLPPFIRILQPYWKYQFYCNLRLFAVVPPWPSPLP